MREILFRGKRIDTDWFYGFYVVDKEDDSAEEYHFIVEKDGRYCEVDENTISQYTGLTDKNGTKIFEGDVVGAYKSITRMVEYAEGLAGYVPFANEICRLGADEVEVIGNIHESEEQND